MGKLDEGEGWYGDEVTNGFGDGDNIFEGLSVLKGALKGNNFVATLTSELLRVR